MFVRSKVVKGRTYYQVVETYRDGDRVRHHTLASLGTHSTIEEALREALGHYFALKRSAPDREEAWRRVCLLDRLFGREQGPTRELDPRLASERRRRRLAANRKSARKDQEKAETWRDFVDSMELEEDSTYHGLLALDLMPTVVEIKAAYRRKARECHPDHGGSEEAMRRLSDAYHGLLKRVRRRSEDCDRSTRRRHQEALPGNAAED